MPVHLTMLPMRVMTDRRSVLSILGAIALLVGAPAKAETWRDMSRTATSITGPITLSNNAITFGNGKTFELVLLDRARVGAFDFTDDAKQVPARLYRVVKPADPVLLNSNRICGSGPVTYLTAYSVKSDSLMLNAYTGGAEPSGTTGMCGSFVYVR